MDFTLSTFIHNKLEEAGIPIEGVAYTSKDEPNIRIDFCEEATDEQKKQAQEIADECSKNKETYCKEWEEKQAEIEKYGSEKNLKFANLLKEKGLLTEEELEVVFK